MKGKIRTSTSGITLIALVITIILLVILATIGVNAVFGEDGLIARAEKAGEKYDIAQEWERLEIVKGEVAIESAQDGNGGRYTVEDYVNKLVSKGIAVDVPTPGTGEAPQTVVTDKGWLVNISQDGLRNVIFDISKYTGTIPMRITNIEVTASLSNRTMKIEVTAVKAEGAKYKYYYKKASEPDTAYKEVYSGTNTSYTIDGKDAETPLEVGTMYTIKVVVEKGSGSSKETDEKTKTAKIEKIQEGLITFTNLTWSNTYDGTASVKIKLSNTAPAGATMKYKIVDIEDTSETTGGTPITSEETITSIQVGKKVIAWIEVGEEKGSPAEIDITENEAPNATMQFSETDIAPEESITATVVLSDDKSGVDINSSKWVYTTDSNPLGTTDSDLSKYQPTEGTIEITYGIFTGAIQDITDKTKWTKEITLQTEEEGEYYLHILTQDNAGNRKEIISSEKITVQGPAVFSTDYGKIEVVWINTTNNIISNPLSPANHLGTGASAMTPVKWNGTTESTTTSTDTSWYSYVAGSGKADNTSSYWANAKTSDGSYFVWIPRYAYRIIYYDKDPMANTDAKITGYCDGEGFKDSHGNVITENEDGTVQYKFDAGLQTASKTESGKTIKYIVHPAFMDDRASSTVVGEEYEAYSHGGWDSALEGIWVAKYEMSRTGATSSNDQESNNITTFKSVPGVKSARNITIGNMYEYSRNYDSGKESHLMKNSEWGAVAYLTWSQYGRNGHEININNSSKYITGIGGASPSANETTSTTNGYNTANGQKASTTGNIYGIYDLSGGTWENVALFNYYDSLDCSTIPNYESANFTGTKESTKYATKYENDIGYGCGEFARFTVGKIGDATKEVYYSKQDQKSWCADSCSLPGPDTWSSPAFARRGGGYVNRLLSGIFTLEGATGKSSAETFRVCLAF